MKTTLLSAFLVGGLLGSVPAPDLAQAPGAGAALAATSAPGIAWFGVWDEAVAEAGRTGKPLLLCSAAPQCRAVPGMW